MSLDDRLKGAYRRQLEDVQQQLAQQPVATPVPAPGPPWGLRMAGVAAALALVVGGFVVVAGLGGDGDLDTARTEAVDGPPEGSTILDSVTSTSSGDLADNAGGADDPADDADQPDSTDQDPLASTTSTPSDPSLTSASPTTDSSPTSETTSTTSATASTPTSGPPTTETSTTVDLATLATGVDSTVCPSGARAELERASTRYVGENRGWGRKDDLVDEQEGPYYFMSWEPNYPQPVTVEIVLPEPVLATDIRVFQDPFTPVSGIVAIEASDVEIAITLSGTDGWRVHNFPWPTVVDRFTVSRDAVESNIMEVMLCVDPSSGS